MAPTAIGGIFQGDLKSKDSKKDPCGDPDSSQRIRVSKAGAWFQACAAEVVAVLAL